MSNAISVCHGAFGRAALYRLDRTIITHAHREGHLIFYVDGDPAEVLIGDRHRGVNCDFATAVSPWEPHCFRVPHNHSCLCLVFYIKPIWFLENCQSAEFSLQFGCSEVRISPRISDLLKRFTYLLLDNHNKQNFDALLFELTTICFQQTWQAVASGGPLQKVCGRFNDFRVRRSLNLMQNYVSADGEMGSLARAVGLSRPHFFKLFKKQMGVTPNIYLNTLKSEQAIDALLNTEKTVTDIAYDLNFSSQGSFTRFFSSNVGIAPSEYRRVAHQTEISFPM